MGELYGKKKREDFISQNYINPEYFFENVNKDLKCCCGKVLKKGSKVYLISSRLKFSNNYYKTFWAGESCGKELIELSNRINGTQYGSIPLLKTCGLLSENEVVTEFGKKNGLSQAKTLDINSYTEYNKEILVAIWLLCCWAWGNPAPNELFAMMLDKIHSNPSRDLDKKYVNYFQKAKERDKAKRSCKQLLEKYKEINKGAFENFFFKMLTI